MKPEDLQMSRTVMSVVKLAGGNQEASSCNDCGNSAVRIFTFPLLHINCDVSENT